VGRPLSAVDKPRPNSSATRIGIHSGPAFRVVFLNDQVLRGRATQTAVYRLIGMSGIGMSGIGMSGIGSGGAQEVDSVDR